ncbi:MAG: hypothetical protein GY859_39155 [Desulfobacterales bacterium]|nr:hypothetical protein [Desulfobacterales bacterium]
MKTLRLNRVEKKFLAIIGLTSGIAVTILLVALISMYVLDIMQAMARGERNHTVAYYQADSNFQAFVHTGDANYFDQFEKQMKAGIAITSSFSTVPDKLKTESWDEIAAGLDKVLPTSDHSQCRGMAILVHLLSWDRRVLELVDLTRRGALIANDYLQLASEFRNTDDNTERRAIYGRIMDVNKLMDKLTRGFSLRVAELSSWAVSVFYILLFVFFVLMTVITYSIAYRIAKSLSGLLKRMHTGLAASSDHLGDSSDNAATSSKSLADGSIQQTTAIEETSTLLEEMSSMTKASAENANKADALMKDANQVVAEANESMNRLTRSMGEISHASEETSKIIKTIDEIAFQTNLLALNAAVEAARAGEAGAGFAVVADEVRNLALRASGAAKNTEEMIEHTIRKVNGGSDLVSNANEAFTRVTKNSTRVGSLIDEIAAASNEQAQGIDQANNAVAEIDIVIRRNSDNAELSAKTSDEMTHQAKNLKVFVDELAIIVGLGIVEKKIGGIA